MNIFGYAFKNNPSSLKQLNPIDNTNWIAYDDQTDKMQELKRSVNSANSHFNM